MYTKININKADETMRRRALAAHLGLKLADVTAEAEAGAVQLMLAAPDLLAALEMVLDAFIHVPGDIAGNKDRTTAARIIGGPNAALARAREAIEKAKKGE